MNFEKAINSEVLTDKPKMQKVREWLNSESKKRDIIFVLFLYAAGVIIHYIMGNFPKAIETYGDELLYLTIAQSIHNGTGIMCMNAATNFKKVLYSLFLSPFFGIEDAVLRIHMINLFNSMLIMTSLILVYFIAKELKFKRGSMILTLLIAFVWPDMMNSMGFMAENLHWPLVLLFIYLWLKSKRSGNIWGYSALLGCLCYIGYLCKDIFVAIFLSYVVFEIIYPFLVFLINHGENKCRLKECFSKKNIIGAVIFIIFFAICYIVGNRILYSGVDSTVSGVISAGFSRLADPYTLGYLFYNFLYYIAAVLIATLIMPVVYSVMNLKKMDKFLQMFFVFLLLYFVVSCGMISYTISTIEDLGRIISTVHLRYIGPVLLLFVVVFLRLLQDKFDFQDKNRGTQLTAALIVLTFASFIFKGTIEGSTTSHCMLNLYRKIKETFVPLTVSSDKLVIYSYVLIVLALLAVVVIVVHCFYIYGFNKISSILFTVIFLGVSIYNNYFEYLQCYATYGIDENMINSIVAINEWFDEANGKRILYLTDGVFGKGHKTVMTYFNQNKYLYSMTFEVFQGFADSNVVAVPDTEFRSYLYKNRYNRIDGFDYILVDSALEIKFKNISLIEEVSNDYFRLYKNDDPTTVELFPLCTFDGNILEIYFSGKEYNAADYCLSGIAKPESGYSWTDGDLVQFEIPVYGDFDSLDVKIEVVGTFAGSQVYEVVQNEEKITEGVINGDGEIVFNARVFDNMLKFDVLCPGSLVVSQVTNSTDNRKVAFRFSKMTVEAHENL